MASVLELGDLRIDVVRRDIKNLHLSVHPPTGRIRLAAPPRLGEAALRAFVIGQLGWIRRQRGKLQAQERETPREYLERESHYVWGQRCLLRLVEHDAPPAIDWQPRKLVLALRPGTSPARRAEVLEAWYRRQLRTAAEPLATQWQDRLGVRAKALFVQRMKTRWGSCNTKTSTLRLNTDLAKKPPECLEYILVHELIHLIEPTHNARFVGLMDRWLPGWEQRRELLNRLPVRHVEWGY